MQCPTGLVINQLSVGYGSVICMRVEIVAAGWLLAIYTHETLE
jgi:hypothetical protein